MYIYSAAPVCPCQFFVVVVVARGTKSNLFKMSVTVLQVFPVPLAQVAWAG